MLGLFPEQQHDCEQSSRRRFVMQLGSLAGILSLDGLLRQQAAVASPAQVDASGKKRSPASDVNCILIWTRGGTSHHDSFDPKPEAKSDIRGEFGTINTAWPGVLFTDLMPRCAQSAKKFTTMRNLNPKNGSHGVADAYMLSGHKFNPTLTYPCYGSVVAKEFGYRGSLPPYVQVNDSIDRRFRGGLSGYLGLAYNPFIVPDDPNSSRFKVRDVTLDKSVSGSRLSRRRQALEAIDTLQRNLDRQPDVFQAVDEYYEKAFDIITSAQTQKAFNLNLEPSRVRDAYGRTRLGQSCLLARRLIESGSRFVTVTDGGWDTHRNNFGTLRKKLPDFDRSFSTLITDLGDRGMLENTLVVWMTDFGRTPKVNSAGGRDHWSTAAPLLMAGAGTPPGVIGETDGEGARPVGREYYTRDIAATIYAKLGIPLHTIHHTPDGRPVALCEGTPIPELMG
ncbi:hypothetical protein Pan216_45080 [Planctomycetes bacterium Pan216]|uniref:Sulfatase n=1 Tax=Kolteria novifilia TaxID=2527975 RepID=A0A518B9L5_9BACT|nr:hypothetical protein Pan216_45080 [Planctomycetes bacterium Pan216]